MADAKFSREEYFAMLKTENITNDYVMAAVNKHLQAEGKTAVTKISEADLYLADVMAIVRITPVPRSITPIDIARILTRLNMTAERAVERMQAYMAVKGMVIHDSLMQWSRSLIELEAALCGYTTLNNIPTSLIRNQMKRPYPPQAYKDKKQSFGTAETVDQRVIRLRLNEVFGAPGIGWRISGLENMSLAHSEPYKERKSDGSEGRGMVQVRAFGWFGEYAVKDVINDAMFYVRTNAIFDGHGNDSFEKAGSGAATALMKEFARLMGGMEESESDIELVRQDD